MNKILLIIQREYLTRVKKKSFIVMTFLVPALFIGMYAAVIYLIVNKDEFTDAKKVTVVDETGAFKNLGNTPSVVYNRSTEGFTQARASFEKSSDDYLLHITSGNKKVLLLSKKKPGGETVSGIENQLNEISRTKRLLAAGIDTSMVNSKADNLEIDAKQITEEGEKDAGIWLAYGVGFVSAFLIYMSLFIYGVQVMRGVIEEKTSRIIEVVISSVKPIQLMLGKIIGVGLVGLTQFTLWVLLSVALTAGAGALFMKEKDVTKIAQQQTVKPGMQQSPVKAEQSRPEAVLASLSTVPWAYTISIFFFYFFFGFMLYSSVFAAVGSAVDSETETQQFMLPITLPLIFTFIISMNFVITNPDSTLAFWLSVIPFTSPIAMMIRIPFGVPGWELALSMALMLGGFLMMSWIAARIYRVGILMYGKKASYKELAKWFFYKE